MSFEAIVDTHDARLTSNDHNSSPWANKKNGSGELNRVGIIIQTKKNKGQLFLDEESIYKISKP